MRPFEKQRRRDGRKQQCYDANVNFQEVLDRRLSWFHPALLTLLNLGPAPISLAALCGQKAMVKLPWYDVEEGCYVEEPAPRLGSCEQQGVTSAPAHDQPQTLPQSSQPLLDQINQQDVGNIIRRSLGCWGRSVFEIRLVLD